MVGIEGAMRRKMNALLAAILMIGTPAAQIKAAPLQVEVQATQTGPTISRDIFGQFAEHLGSGIYGGIWVGPKSSIPNVRGIRSDVVAALRAIRVPNVRWPGGCFADNYHWRNGIGPQEQRPATLNPDWAGVIEPNSFGTDEYFDFLQQIGADAFISENIGSGTVAEAADWFEYMTSDKPTTLAKLRGANGHPRPYQVRFLGLGNESWGCGGAMSPEHYVELMKQFSHYTRNYNPEQQAAGRAMKRIAVGWDSGNSDYTEAVMKAWKDRVWSWDIEGISLHGYTIPNSWETKGPSSNFGEDEYAKAIRATLNMNGWIDRQVATMDKYDPDRKVGLYVDEWGIWTDPDPNTNPGFLQQHNTLRDGIIAALNLDIFMRHADRVQGSNIAQMVNVLQALVITRGEKMALTPTYFVYKMYVPFQGARLIPVKMQADTYTHDTTSLPRTDAVAARDSSGRLWLALVNIDPRRAVEINAAFGGKDIRSATGTILTASAVDAYNDVDAPPRVVPRPYHGEVSRGSVLFALPPAAIAVVQLQ